MIKAVIFDFFGVLVSEGFKVFCDTHFAGEPEKRRLATEAVNRHDAGQTTADEFYDELSKLAGIEYGVAQALNTNQPNKPLLDYIRYILKDKYKLGVLSNSGDDYITKLLKPEDVELFDDIVLSYRYKIVKPQPEIYELALNRLGCLAHEVILVDDSPRHATGARDAGMQAILYVGFPSMKDELEKILSAGTGG